MVDQESQLLLFTSYNDLTPLHRLKCLHGDFRKQLGTCNTPDECKVDTASLKWVRRAVTCSVHSPSMPSHLITLPVGSPWPGEEWHVCPTFWLYGGLSTGLLSLFYNLKSSDRTGIVQISGGLLKEREREQLLWHGRASSAGKSIKHGSIQSQYNYTWKKVPILGPAWQPSG